MFYDVITSLGLHPNYHDFALICKSLSHGHVIISLYVDDMIITSDNVDVINKLKLQLSKQFEMKDLGTLCYFLGIEVAYSPRGYLLSQYKNISNILDQACYYDTRITDSPLELNVKYASSD